MKFVSNRAIATALAVATLAAAPLAAQNTETENAAAMADTDTDAKFEAENDPFIWLEETRSVPALTWVRSENERVDQTLGADPRFAELKAEALAILDSEDRIPGVSFTPHGLVNFWQDAKNPRGILRLTTLESYRSEKPEWETILDIDALAKAEGREWVFHGMSCLPPASDKCMVALSDGGKDADEMREFDFPTRSFVDGGFFLPESQGSASWVDADTLLVSRDFGEGTTTESHYPFTTREWKRGTDLAAAPEIFRGEPKDVSAGAALLRDSTGTIQGRYAYRGLDFHDRAYFLMVDGEWVKLDMPEKSGLFGIVDDHILFSTDVDWTVGGTTFPADSIVAAKLDAWKADPNGAAKELVWAPGDRQTKQGAAITANSMFVNLLDNVRGQVLKFDYVDGSWVSERVPLPDNATVGVAAADDNSDRIMYSVTDFLTPSTLYFSDGTDAPEVIKTSPARFDTDGMEVEQFEATSKDGTKIPYFLVKPKGMVMDGTTPTLLSGYGGFQIPRLPSYLGTTGKLWLSRGGAYVLGNMRGGGEFGPQWHQTAIRENKQRTWDDFEAIADDLVARKITSPKHLGIQGGSQGGLLVGTAFTQRPDLYNAAIVQIPLFDMLRYFEIGRGASWIGEYGDPRIPEQRAWIEPYSPYQKLASDIDFPTPFFITSTADDRTHPAHGRKAAARMSKNGQAYYYYEDMTGGHSGGVDNDQRAKLLALQNVYLMQQLMDEGGGYKEE
ncbi:prolyl oligopeptidase family serine peptidase [Erythrobacter sp. LQ02-29]|uniref:prolyl oligopeptidase family serine peptidase n=1 Tax=Erythrobacter sp. LQ02-29 TaxID=2920384 RepID=UPI001F4F0C31|nr:prolyl oligopeptidase family serine peptidase [Erythrobacter sp. LQ02-29]MCP9222706.1 prolyl oligopeptidase family serine peptidase [Erythrobacter sp. LQ02-29]